MRKKQPVRDHCHFTGKYRGPAHNECNRQFRKPKFTPIFFHNLSGYDSHLFIKNLGKTQGKIRCIPNKEERYISFSKNIKVYNYTDKETRDDVYIQGGSQKFADSKMTTNNKMYIPTRLHQLSLESTSNFSM